MKIENTLNPLLNNDAKAAAEARGKEKTTGLPSGEAKAEETGRADVVELSERSRLVARARELAAGAPEVRQDKIDDVRSRLAAGTYNISGRTVAEAMLKKSITEV